jgi:hypothetical protein
VREIQEPIIASSRPLGLGIEANFVDFRPARLLHAG